MLRASPLVALALALAFFGAPRAAAAHTLLVNPPPLSSDDNAKSGPCGCYFGAGPEDPADDGTAAQCAANYTTTELVAGSQLTVSWKETVLHDGTFRLAIAPLPVDGVKKADLDAGVLYEKTDANTVAGATITATITVPSEPCASCTLQLRQLMTGATNPYYWSCAAIKIVPAGGTSGSGPSGAGGAGGDGQGGSTSSPAGAGGNESTAAGVAVPPPQLKTGACSASPLGDTSPFGAGVLLAAIAMTRCARRRLGR
jgi:hypothetical protein